MNIYNVDVLPGTAPRLGSGELNCIVYTFVSAGSTIHSVCMQWSRNQFWIGGGGPKQHVEGCGMRSAEYHVHLVSV